MKSIFLQLRNLNTLTVLILACVVAALSAFVINYFYVYNHFYYEGAFLSDSGWFSALGYRNDALLTSPMVIDSAGVGGSFFEIHTPFFLSWLSWLSWCLPIDRLLYYPLFQGFIYGLLACTFAYASHKALKQPSITTLMLGCTSLFLFTFNGVAISAMSFPHFEALIPAFIILFLAILPEYLQSKSDNIDSNRSLARLLLVGLVTISLREDAGFHLAAPLLLMGVAGLIFGRNKKIWKYTLLFGLLLAGASVIIILWQKVFFPGGDALKRVYLGDPVFSHLSLSLLKERALFLFEQRIYIWGPWVLLLGVALWKRNWLLGVGVIAYMPWFLLSFCSVSFAPAQFHSYYGFPFIIVVAWPLLASLYQPLVDEPGGYRWIWLQFAVVLLSIAGFISSDKSTALYILENGWHKRNVDAAAVNRLRTYLRTKEWNNQSPLVIVDASVASLEPQYIPASFLYSPDKAQSPSIFIHYSNGYQMRTLPKALETTGINYVYKVKGTQIRLATTAVLPQDFPLLPILENPHGLLFLKLFPATPSERLSVEEGIQGESTTPNKEQLIAYGPYWTLGEGHYRVTYKLTLFPANSTKVLLRAAGYVVDTQRVYGEIKHPVDLVDNTPKNVEFSCDIIVPKGEIVANLECYLLITGQTRYELNDAIMTPVNE
ncbi:MAG: hypothetical protein SFY80_07420 [Verrucomicrobiota bacterium]|nr:hypothetical protein [Verrucomicrobiota bacterium]